MKTRPNLKNFFYLLSSGLIIQLLGTVYRIWLARKIGAEGLGVFQMSYPVYRLLSSIATIGLPLALTKWVAEYLANQQFSNILKLKQWAVRTAIIGALITTTLLYLNAAWLSRTVFAEPRLQTALYIVAIAIPFSALSSIYRGYFQGFSLMAPTAVSEITEQIAEIGVTYLCIVSFVHFSSNMTYSFPILGLTVGEIICYLTLVWFNRSKHPVKLNGYGETHLPRMEIFNYSWPLLLNQIVVAINMSSEAALIPRLLTSTGISPSNATGLLGLLNGIAAPVAYFPLIFILPLATVLSPQVSSAMKVDSLASIRKKLILFYTFGLLIGLIGFLLIFLNTVPLAKFLYGTTNAVSTIRLLTLGLPFSGLAILNVTILGAVGASPKILMLSLWSLGLKTALFFILIHRFGINGAAWAITVTQIFIFLASLAEIVPYFPWFSAQNPPKWLQRFHFLRHSR